MLKRIISGGQTGADRGGLDAAVMLGIKHGGSCPAGRRAEDDGIPLRYRMSVLPIKDYSTRTRLNVYDSDATLVIVRGQLTPGSALTVQSCRKLERPLFVARIPSMASVRDVARSVALWLDRVQPETLNVAGSRESTAPGIQLDACALVVLAIRGMERPSSSKLELF
jgi:hypothetical protein